MRAKCKNWPRMASISSMLRTMRVDRSGSICGPAISTPRRSLVRGVRRSCDTPASISARSWSAWARLWAMWLKLRATVAISVGPSSASGPGGWPRARRCAACTTRCSGWLRWRCSHQAPTSASTMLASVAMSQAPVNSRVGKTLGRLSQYSVPSCTTRSDSTPLLSRRHKGSADEAGVPFAASSCWVTARTNCRSSGESTARQVPGAAASGWVCVRAACSLKACTNGCRCSGGSTCSPARMAATLRATPSATCTTRGLKIICRTSTAAHSWPSTMSNAISSRLRPNRLRGNRPRGACVVEWGAEAGSFMACPRWQALRRRAQTHSPRPTRYGCGAAGPGRLR